jgi:hypothetical protein
MPWVESETYEFADTSLPVNDRAMSPGRSPPAPDSSMYAGDSVASG